MAQGRRFAPRGRSSTRRKTSWSQGPGGVAVQTQVSATGKTLVTTGAQTTLDGLTQVRLRGMALFHLISAGSQLDGFAGAFGIGVATATAFSAGAGSLPGPIAEIGWDGWLYHTFLDLRAPDPVDSGVADDKDIMLSVTGAQRLMIDSKAMRKLNSSEVTFAMLEVTEVGVSILSWRFNSRVLDKLP